MTWRVHGGRISARRSCRTGCNRSPNGPVTETKAARDLPVAESLRSEFSNLFG